MSFQSCFQAEGCQHKTLFFFLAIIVILLPLPSWIKHICLVVLAGQQGCAGCTSPD